MNCLFEWKSVLHGVICEISIPANFVPVMMTRLTYVHVQCRNLSHMDILREKLVWMGGEMECWQLKSSIWSVHLLTQLHLTGMILMLSFDMCATGSMLGRSWDNVVQFQVCQHFIPILFICHPSAALVAMTKIRLAFGISLNKPL